MDNKNVVCETVDKKSCLNFLSQFNNKIVPLARRAKYTRLHRLECIIFADNFNFIMVNLFLFTFII